MDDTPQNHADPRLTTLMLQVTEIRTQLAGFGEKLGSIANAQTQISSLDKLVSNFDLRLKDHDGQLTQVWQRVDDLNTWRTRYAAETIEAMQALRESCNANTAAVSNRVNEAKAEFSGAKKVLVVLSMVFGGMISAGAVWMVTTVVDSKERLAVIEHQQGVNK